MDTICGLCCCETCERKAECKGCLATDGKPFGGECAAAVAIRRGKELSEVKAELIRDVNALEIPDLSIDDLYLLSGFFVNMAYPVSSGEHVRFLRDENIYFGNQVVRPSGRCYGVIADEKFLLVSEYGENGESPALILYKKREKLPNET